MPRTAASAPGSAHGSRFSFVRVPVLRVTSGARYLLCRSCTTARKARTCLLLADGRNAKNQEVTG
eukprot:7390826-Prymnesium_polylepis.1